MSPHIGNFPVPAYPKPLSIFPAALLPQYETHDHAIVGGGFRNRTVLDSQYFHEPVFLPHGAKVKRLTLVGFRNDALAIMEIQLRRVTDGFTFQTMATVTADWTTGGGSKYTETIYTPDIDNETYSYMIQLELDPNDAVADVGFYRAIIDWD